ncbi:MAG: ABC transporter permease [Candidatus Thorarchaeota archaeon]|jgi:ABC-type dipeptide/oligopeptide/nickel transport system permease subunit
MERIVNRIKSLESQLRNHKVWAMPRGERIPFLFGLACVIVIMALAVFANIIAPFSPFEIPADSGHLPPGSWPYILGTDALGRDVLSRAIHGAQVSLLLGLSAVVFAAIFGGTLGVLTGYFGGLADRLITLPLDAMYSFPTFLIALLMVTTLGGGAEYTAIAVGVGLLPRFYRSMRSASIALREEEFVEAEVSLGASGLYIVFKHIYPLCFSVLLVVFTVGIATSILTIAGLGFLGLGVPTPIPEWGTDLNLGRPHFLSGIWWTTGVPSIFIFFTVLGFNLVGDGLNKLFGAVLEEF